MKEGEVNKKCREWLEGQGFKYKGILNSKPKEASNNTGYGQVSVPDGNRRVLIDHQGVSDRDKSIIWLEAKGEGDKFSELLEGFIRVLYACYHGGGMGLLAVPDNEYNQLLEQREFLANVAKAGERRIGLLNAETQGVEWLT